MSCSVTVVRFQVYDLKKSCHTKLTKSKELLNFLAIDTLSSQS
jgi:hypothetical protein